jgi:hypothetical protein
MPPRPRSKADKIPAGWYCREQLQKEWNLRDTQTKRLLQLAVDCGDAKVEKFRVKRPTGIFMIPFYKFKN